MKELLINTDLTVPHYLIVAGSRNYNDLTTFNKILTELLGYLSEVTIISGLAKGPDSMAVEYYYKNKGTNKTLVGLKKYKAEWDNVAHIKSPKRNKFGKLYNPMAGLERNARMLEEATMLLAFWDGNSRGTKHMIDIATKEGIPVIVVE